jgi:hypothetical protein
LWADVREIPPHRQCFHVVRNPIMTHQTYDEAQDFDAKKFFIKARRLYIEEPLRELGFKKYKSSVIARLTSENVFQFLDFQKSAYGGQDFTVNVAIRPMFCPNNDYLTLNPGNRLGLMALKPRSDRWWNYSTQAEGERSFVDVFEMIKRFALPFFDATKTSTDIISAYDKNIFGKNKFGDRVTWGTTGWEDFDLGHIYLHSGETKKAIKHFNLCIKEFQKDERDWAQTAAAECLSIKKIIASGKTEVNKYIAETKKSSIEKLKLSDW